MVQCPENGKTGRRATLYNTFGQSMLETIFTGSSHTLSLQSFPAGIYWLIIRENGRIVYQQAVIKN